MQRFGLNPTTEDVHKMIEDADVDAGGSVDFEEFLAMIKRGDDYGGASQLSLTRIVARVRAYKQALDDRDGWWR